MPLYREHKEPPVRHWHTAAVQHQSWQRTFFLLLLLFLTAPLVPRATVSRCRCWFRSQ